MKSAKGKMRLSKWIVNLTLLFLVILWTIPTMGIFISSFRQRQDIATSGWWLVFPHREWQVVKTINPKELNLDPNAVMNVEGASATFDQLREGIETPGGKRLIWIGNKRIGTIQIQEQVWTVMWNFTLDNYKQVLGGQTYTFTKPDGTTQTVQGDNMTRAFLSGRISKHAEA